MGTIICQDTEARSAVSHFAELHILNREQRLPFAPYPYFNGPVYKVGETNHGC